MGKNVKTYLKNNEKKLVKKSVAWASDRQIDQIKQKGDKKQCLYE